MSEHTPGPWRAVPQPGQTVGVHTYTHCVMYGDDSIADTLTEADARLIAAAPDLLAACKSLVNREDLLPGVVCSVCETERCPTSCPVRMARAAIAKAGGAA